MSGEMTKSAVRYCRAHITKDEALRYISHLDYASLMQRAICRAKLPAAYSEGFNPHMKLSFASALSVGVTSEAEYMELEIAGNISASEIEERLRGSLPSGVRLLGIQLLDVRPKALMSLTDEAEYEIEVPLCGSMTDAAAALDAFNAAKECLYLRKTPKKTREIEVKQYILGDIRAKEIRTDKLRLAMAIRVTPGGSVKPQEVLALLAERFSLPVRAQEALIHRCALLSGGKPLLPKEVRP